MSERENQQKNFRRATKGLPHEYQEKIHRNLAKYYPDRKDYMDFDELFDVVKEVMGNYSEWSWDKQKQKWSEQED
jgi:hypothetical protein